MLIRSSSIVLSDVYRCSYVNFRSGHDRSPELDATLGNSSGTTLFQAIVCQAYHGHMLNRCGSEISPFVAKKSDC